MESIDHLYFHLKISSFSKCCKMAVSFSLSQQVESGFEKVNIGLHTSADREADRHFGTQCLQISTLAKTRHSPQFWRADLCGGNRASGM